MKQHHFRLRQIGFVGAVHVESIYARLVSHVSNANAISVVDLINAGAVGALAAPLIGT